MGCPEVAKVERAKCRAQIKNFGYLANNGAHPERTKRAYGRLIDQLSIVLGEPLTANRKPLTLSDLARVTRKEAQA